MPRHSPTTISTVDSQQPENSNIRWWTILALLVATGILFGPVIATERSFLFRDVAHFYAPLWEWARGEWAQGRVPLWNPLQNLGVPHLAENTSSVFYPGKLLFALPGPFDRYFHIFLASHVLFAGFTMHRLMRSWGRSNAAAGIAAVSYALSGGVLFQYCNPPFLIGAAWLPVAVGSAARLLRQRSLANAARVAAVLAVMILGGDAQTVYHVGLMMVLLAVIHWRDSRNTPFVPLGVPVPAQSRSFFNGLKWIAVAAIICVGLTAVQILPTSQHTAASVRATYEAPRSLDELALDAIRRKPLQIDGLIAKSDQDAHHKRAFDFSVGPWRWPELIWPNVSGRWFPVNARWIQSVPAEGRTWTPSLYLGLIPFWLAICAIRNRKRLPLEGRWLVGCTLIAILGSMGAYGIGWLVVDWHVRNGGIDATASVGRNFGGMYWLMTVVLPWYVKFRYPAKLWTIATFGMSALAGLEWDRRQATGIRRARGLMFVGRLSLIGVAVVLMLQTPIKQAWGNALLPESIFGPLDVDRAWRDVVWAFGQTAFISIVVWTVFSARSASSSRWLGVFVILLITTDLVTTHHWMLPSAPTSQLGTSPTVAAATPYPPRVYRSPAKGWRPKNWFTSSSADRLQELMRQDRESLYPQHHLTTGQSVLGARTTIPNRDWESIMAELQQNDETQPTRLAELGVDCIIIQNDEGFTTKSLEPGDRVWAVDPQTDAKIENAQCTIDTYAPQDILVSAKVPGPALIVLSEQYHPDWQVSVARSDQKTISTAPLLKTNGVLRGVRLEDAGEYTIRYRFVSNTFRWGAAVSVATWAILLLSCAVQFIRHRSAGVPLA